MLFKDTAGWVAAYEQLKRVLAQRDDVPKGIKSAEKRKRIK